MARSAPTTCQSPTPRSIRSTTQPTVLGVVDLGASAIRLLVAQRWPGEPLEVLEEASRAMLLGRDTFSTARIGAATMSGQRRPSPGGNTSLIRTNAGSAFSVQPPRQPAAGASGVGRGQ